MIPEVWEIAYTKVAMANPWIMAAKRLEDTPWSALIILIIIVHQFQNNHFTIYIGGYYRTYTNIINKDAIEVNNKHYKNHFFLKDKVPQA